jgi:hypothetical protein
MCVLRPCAPCVCVCVLFLYTCASAALRDALLPSAHLRPAAPATRDPAALGLPAQPRVPAVHRVRGRGCSHPLRRPQHRRQPVRRQCDSVPRRHCATAATHTRGGRWWSTRHTSQGTRVPHHAPCALLRNGHHVWRSAPGSVWGSHLWRPSHLWCPRPCHGDVWCTSYLWWCTPACIWGAGSIWADVTSTSGWRTSLGLGGSGPRACRVLLSHALCTMCVCL